MRAVVILPTVTEEGIGIGGAATPEGCGRGRKTRDIAAGVPGRVPTAVSDLGIGALGPAATIEIDRSPAHRNECARREIQQDVSAKITRCGTATVTDLGKRAQTATRIESDPGRAGKENVPIVVSTCKRTAVTDSGLTVFAATGVECELASPGDHIDIAAVTDSATGSLRATVPDLDTGPQRISRTCRSRDAAFGNNADLAGHVTGRKSAAMTNVNGSVLARTTEQSDVPTTVQINQPRAAADTLDAAVTDLRISLCRTSPLTCGDREVTTGIDRQISNRVT